MSETEAGRTEATRAVMLELFQRMAARDPERIAELFADEVDWYIPGDTQVAPWVGRRHTRADVAAFYRMLNGAVTPLGADLQSLLVDGDVAVAAGEFSSRMERTGRVLDSLFFIHATVRDGRIVRYRLLEDTLAVVASLTP
jgi:ketosteroid isomerase-like protein